MFRAITITAPKCRGFTPSLTATGVSIGARMMMAAVRSMKHPTIRRNMHEYTMKRDLLVEIPMRKLASAAGICSAANTQLSTPPMDTRRSETPVV